ncbi:MAG: hypothetical protein ACEY3A_02285 [Wolbachia sp.]
MVGITSALQAGKKESIGPSIQLTNEDKKTFKKKKHQLIYRAFLNTLEKPEKQTQQKIKEIEKKLQEKLSKEQEQKLLGNLKSLKERVPQLQNENEKKIFTFVFENRGKIFNDVNQRIKSLSEENFLQFLISVFEKIREKNLASKENLENNKIKEVVDKCVDDIRSTEAKDSLIKLAGWPLGIKIDPKNISGSLTSGLKDKIPFLGGGKEKDEPPLSDEEMVTTFLRKSLLPVAFFAFTTLIFGTGPIMIGIAIVGLLFTEVNAVKSLFSNNRKGTLYNPETEEEKEWGSKISGILKTPVEGAGRDNQPAVTPGKQQNSEQPNKPSHQERLKDQRQKENQYTPCP